MFKVIVNLRTYFTLFSSVSTVDFGQENSRCVEDRLLKT